MNMWNLFSNYIKYIIYNIIWIHQFIKSIVIFHIYLMLLQILCDFLTCFSERLSFSRRKYVLKIYQVLDLHIQEFKTKTTFAFMFKKVLYRGDNSRFLFLSECTCWCQKQPQMSCIKFYWYIKCLLSLANWVRLNLIIVLAVPLPSTRITAKNVCLFPEWRFMYK